MNLSTAQSLKRVREIGIRKVAGARRFLLVRQFLGESVFQSVFAFFIGIILLRMILPYFNSFVDRNIEIGFLLNKNLFPVLFGIVLLTGVVSGSYPALFMSRFQPSNIMRGSSHSGLKASHLRNILVIAQFSISIVLIAGTMIILKQLYYIKNERAGYNTENTLVINLRDSEIWNNYKTFRNELLGNPDITGVSASSNIMGVGRTMFEGNDGEPVTLPVYSVFIDYDYLSVFEIELIAGRDFSRDVSSDRTQAVIVNEQLVRKMGWKNPLGKRAALQGMEGYVIGVIKDFHFQSFYEPINPLAYILNPGSIWYMYIKIRSADITEIIKIIEDAHNKINPNHPFEYSFLDETFDRLYRTEQKLGSMFSYFSALAIFIACLGLFGLASFAVERRTKEIGVRKVLGASVLSIVYNFSGEFVKLIIIANIIALPVAYFAMNKWLEDFAYRISIGIWIFMISAAIAFVIALLTVGFQAVKAAVANPAEALRFE